MERFLLFAGFIFPSIAIAFLPLIVFDTLRRKGRWGFNLKSVDCPRCGTRQKKANFSLWQWRPNQRQWFWGGYTCKNCRCKMDKWGNEISSWKYNSFLEGIMGIVFIILLAFWVFIKFIT